MISKLVFSCFCGILSLLLIFGMTDISLAQEMVTVTPSVDPPGGGTISPSNPVTVARGSTVEFTATANEGYCLDKFVMDGQEWLAEELGDYGTFRIIGVQENTTLVAHFVKCYEIWASVVGEGTINPSGYERVLEGESRTYVITPKPGYVIADVIVNDQSVGPRSELSFEYINSDLTIFAIFEKESFTITVRATAGGIVGPTQSGGTIGPDGGQFKVEVSPGEGWTFNIESIDCYEIKEVKIDGELIGSGGTSGRVPFTNVRRDYVLDVTFGEVGPFTIKVSANTGGEVGPTAGGGTIGPAGGEFEVVVPCGGGWILKITPHDCFEIKDVRLDESSMGPLPELIFSNVRKNHVVSVVFQEAGPFTITAAVAEGEGSFEPAGDAEGRFRVACGEDAQYKIIPGDCFKIKDVKVDGQSVMGDVRIITPITGTGVYVFTNVRKDHRIEAYFEPIYYNITVKQNTGGKIEPGGVVKVKCGDSETFTITPDPCYRIKSVKVDGEPVGASIDPKTGIGSYTFSDVRRDHEIEAEFEKIEFFIIEVTRNKPEGGNVEPEGDNGKVKVNCGADQTFIISLNKCYELERVEVDGKPVDVIRDPKTGNFSYTFTRVVQNHKMDVFYKEMGPFTITGAVIPDGKIVPRNPVKVECGEDQPVTITPNDCWEIEWIEIDGYRMDMATNPDFKVLDPKTGESRYTFKDVRRDHTITVKFKKKKYEIAASAAVAPGVPGPGGTIAPGPGIVTVDCGEDESFKMTPAVGYRVMDVLVNGASVGATTAYTFRDVRANQTISVIFMPIASTIFTITAEAGDGGEIEPSGEIKVGAGGSQKFDITPDAEHIVDDVEVNSQSMGPLDEYTFSNVQSDGHISVKFRLRGDVDGDGRVNAKDAILTLRIAAGLITPDERQKKAADMSGDGVVKSNDAILVLRVAAGL